MTLGERTVDEVITEVLTGERMFEEETRGMETLDGERGGAGWKGEEEVTSEIEGGWTMEGMAVEESDMGLCVSDEKRGEEEIGTSRDDEREGGD